MLKRTPPSTLPSSSPASLSYSFFHVPYFCSAPTSCRTSSFPLTPLPLLLPSLNTSSSSQSSFSSFHFSFFSCLFPSSISCFFSFFLFPLFYVFFFYIIFYTSSFCFFILSPLSSSLRLHPPLPSIFLFFFLFILSILRFLLPPHPSYLYHHLLYHFILSSFYFLSTHFFSLFLTNFFFHGNRSCSFLPNPNFSRGIFFINLKLSLLTLIYLLITPFLVFLHVLISPFSLHVFLIWPKLIISISLFFLLSRSE